MKRAGQTFFLNEHHCNNVAALIKQTDNNFNSRCNASSFFLKMQTISIN